MSIDIPPNSVSKEGLGRIGGKAVGGEQSTEKGVNRGKVEHMGIKVIEWSMD